MYSFWFISIHISLLNSTTSQCGSKLSLLVCRDGLCVCVGTNFLRWSGFLCGCSALCCWSICGIDLMREVEGGRGGYG